MSNTVYDNFNETIFITSPKLSHGHTLWVVTCRWSHLVNTLWVHLRQCLRRNFFIDLMQTTCVDENIPIFIFVYCNLIYVQRPRIVSGHAMTLNLNWPIYYYYYYYAYNLTIYLKSYCICTCELYLAWKQCVHNILGMYCTHHRSWIIIYIYIYCYWNSLWI